MSPELLAGEIVYFQPLSRRPRARLRPATPALVFVLTGWTANGSGLAALAYEDSRISSESTQSSPEKRSQSDCFHMHVVAVRRACVDSVQRLFGPRIGARVTSCSATSSIRRFGFRSG